MSLEAVAFASDRQIFRPRKKFAQLSHDHVAFDTLTESESYESRSLGLITSGERHCVAIRGPIGSGKSSLIASVISRLPSDHVGLRVPIVAAGDPTNITDLAAMTLSAALDAFDLENQEREALEKARADGRIAAMVPGGITGGKLGGGPVPAELNVQFNSLREERESKALAGDRLYGIERLISILTANGREPIFVLEDTEAAIGGDDPARVEAFFDGSIRAFMSEIDATLLIAIQDHLVVKISSYAELEPNMVSIDLPNLDDRTPDALASIASHRLSLFDVEFRLRDLFEPGAIETLADGYREELGSSMRLTLAAMQGASEIASDVGAELVTPTHIREAIEDWALRRTPRR